MGSLSRDFLSGGPLCPGDLCPGGLCLGGSMTRKGLCPGGSLSRGFSVQEVVSVCGSLSRGSLSGRSPSVRLCVDSMNPTGMQSCLARFLPKTARKKLDQEMGAHIPSSRPLWIRQCFLTTRMSE